MEERHYFDNGWFYSVPGTRRQVVQERYYQSSMFSTCQVWWFLQLRHSAYKLEQRSNSFTYGNKQRSILYTRESGDHILGLQNLILQKLPNCKIVISIPKLRTGNATDNNRNRLFVNHLKWLNIKLILNQYWPGTKGLNLSQWKW